MSETGSQIGDSTKVEKKKIEVKFKDVFNIDINPEENTLTISKFLKFNYQKQKIPKSIKNTQVNKKRAQIESLKIKLNF